MEDPLVAHMDFEGCTPCRVLRRNRILVEPTAIDVPVEIIRNESGGVEGSVIEMVDDLHGGCLAAARGYCPTSPSPSNQASVLSRVASIGVYSSPSSRVALVPS